MPTFQIALLVLAPFGAYASSAEDVEFFEKKARPDLVTRCYACHSAETKPSGGLRVDDRNSLLNGGNSGSAVVAGDPDASLLMQRVRDADPKRVMPNEGDPLTKAEVEDVIAWIRNGAAWPAEKIPEGLLNPKADYAHLRARHWAFKPITRSQPPVVANTSWPRSDVDRFVLAKLQERKLKPVGDASRIDLIRRITFDLTGLPPTPEETRAFNNSFLASRRSLLRTTGAGFGHLALSRLLGTSAAKEASTDAMPKPLAAKAPHFTPKAKSIIFLYMEAAISGVDTFEYKPELQKNGGKSGPGGGVLTPSKFQWKQYGQSDSWFSELLPNNAQHADDLCWLRGLHTDTPAHPQAVVQLHTGSANAALTRPSMSAWLLYGLGTENQDLPGHATINPQPNFGGAVNYGSAFLSAHFQGTRISDTGHLPNVQAASAGSLQRRQIDLIRAMNRDLAAKPSAPDPVDGIIESYELAFRMQSKVPELLDVSKEPQSVLDAYGVKPGPERSFARQCLMARPLSEAGVRFVEICQGGWEHHTNLHKGLIERSRQIDQPTAALFGDLKQRGLMKDTLVLFGSEFGRLPMAQRPDGRDHNTTGCSMFLTGAGVKKGFSYGATDELGANAVEGRMHTNDLHATLVALIGLHHKQLTFRYAGRDFRLTDVAGEVHKEIFA